MFSSDAVKRPGTFDDRGRRIAAGATDLRGRAISCHSDVSERIRD